MFNGEGTVTNCNFVNNTASVDGGAVYFVYSEGTVTECNFTNNTASRFGGAVDFDTGYTAPFTVTNCNFVNNNASAGGAIYFIFSSKGTFENCNFTNNTASENGGAVYFYSSTGTVTNCNFVNNTASENGGAVYFVSSTGTVTNCNFVNNTASENGGALYGGTANNCIFNDNHADQFGGAIYHGDVEGSTFTNNSAYIGGAIYNCSAVNCNFTGNNAHDGGAVAISMVSNCTFNNNSALALGGAAVNSSATQCIFINNTANEGEALCLGSQILCTFINNNCSQTNSLAFKFSDFTAYYKSGKKLLVGLICDGKTFDGISTTLNVYQNDALIGTYHCLSGDGWVVNLNPGIYNVVLSVDEHQDIEPVNVTLTILKLPTTITSKDVNTVYNGNKYLIVTLKDINSKSLAGVKVTIKLSNGKTYTPATDKNGQVKLTTNGLAPKTYTAAITFAGNANYVKSTKSVKVIVKKATPKLTAGAKTFKKKVKVKKYTVTLKTNQNKVMKNTKVYLKINKKTYTANTNAKGQATFKITKLTKKGTFKATVTYKGSAYYNKVTKNVKIKIK